MIFSAISGHYHDGQTTGTDQFVIGLIADIDLPEMGAFSGMDQFSGTAYETGTHRPQMVGIDFNAHWHFTIGFQQ